MNTNWLEDLTVGDEAAIRSGEYVEIHRVQHADNGFLHCGNGIFKRSDGKEIYDMPDAWEIAPVTDGVRERVELQKTMKCLFEDVKWRNLTTDQLRRIAGIINETD